MRKKRNREAGFTMVEMLMALLVLAMASMMTATGIQVALRSHRILTAQNEAELLLSSAVDAIADELRYAWNVKTDTSDYTSEEGVNVEFTYYSDSYSTKTEPAEAETTYLNLDGDGRIIAENKTGGSNKVWQVLPAGTYGEGGKYTVESMKITLITDPTSALSGDLVEVTFTIELTVTDGNISASTPSGGVTVRCLNKMTVT